MSDLPAVIERSITLRAGETVVAYRHTSDQDWALVTTQRLRWFIAATLVNLDLAGIHERSVKRQKDRAVMRFVTRDGEHYDMPIDEGGAYAAFWSAISSLPIQ